MRGLSPLDTAFFGALNAGPVYPVTNITTDDGDDYAAGAITDNSLEGGSVNENYPWKGKWRYRDATMRGILVQDDFEEYADGDAINGKSGGYRWSGNWVNR